MSKLLNYLNEGISDLHPYEPGRSIDEVVAEYKPDKVVKLASNENPLGPGEKVQQAIAEAATALSRYPDGGGFALLEREGGGGLALLGGASAVSQ